MSPTAHTPDPERAALVGLITASSDVCTRSIRSTSSPAWPSGRRRRSCCACRRSARSPIRRRFSAAARSTTLAAACDEADVDVVIFDNELSPGAAAQHRGSGVERKVRRSHAAHPRHLRAARAHAGRQAAGGAGAAEVPAAAAGRHPAPRCRGWAAASARAAPAKRSSKPIGAASAQRIQRSRAEIEEVRRRRAQLRERRHKASMPTVALVGYTNAGKTTLFNLLTRRDGGGVATRCS